MANLEPSPIDMMTPRQAVRHLHLSDSAVLDAVNSGRLAAYNLGQGIRFKSADVHALRQALITT